VSRPTKVPVYRKHAKSGQAVVTLTGPGGRRDQYLGPYGSPESHRQYARSNAGGLTAHGARVRDTYDNESWHPDPGPSSLPHRL
jgi:hypothetical protein